MFSIFLSNKLFELFSELSKKFFFSTFMNFTLYFGFGFGDFIKGKNVLLFKCLFLIIKIKILILFIFFNLFMYFYFYFLIFLIQLDDRM
jgi:hypothetical protein